MAGKDLGRDIFLAGMRQLLAPVAAFCLKKGIRIQDIVPELKQALIEAARKDLQARGQEESISRLSVMTGLQRKELSHLEAFPDCGTDSADMLSRVLSVWTNSARFCDKKSKKPRQLTYEGNQSEFAALVRHVSSDLNHHTVLFELERASAAVRNTLHGTVSLSREEFITYDDPQEAYSLLARDIGALINTVDANLVSQPQDRMLHATTQFDNVYVSAIPELKAWILAAGRKLHEEARRLLAQYDADTTSVSGKKNGEGKAGVRIGIGTFGILDISEKKSSDRGPVPERKNIRKGKSAKRGK